MPGRHGSKKAGIAQSCVIGKIPVTTRVWQISARWLNWLALSFVIGGAG